MSDPAPMQDLADRLFAAEQDADAYHHDLCAGPCSCGAPGLIRDLAAVWRTLGLARRGNTRPPAEATIRAREMNLYRSYFDLVASGRKTVEVRVQYPNLRGLGAGDHIRFVCGTDECLTRVVRVARYGSFEQMLDAEGPERVNPDSPREQQLANIRRIYGPEKEALGVLAIEIQRV